jgi:hypothetical protein
MTFDPKCYDLAKTFLEDAGLADEPTVRELAVEIQETIENFIVYESLRGLRRS